MKIITILLSFHFAILISAQTTKRAEKQILNGTNISSSNELTWKYPSSFSTEDENSESYFYEELIQYWDNGRWVNLRKTTFVRDSDNNLVEKASYDSYNNLDTKTNYTYDNSNNLIEEVRHFTYYKHKIIYSYDVHNNLIQKLTFYSPSSTTIDWKEVEKVTYTYDNNNNLIEELNEKVLRIKMTYNNNNILIKRIEQTWNNYSYIWEDSYKEDNVYDAYNNLIEQISQMWYDEWLPQSKKTYTYFPNNKLMHLLDYWWETNAWFNWQRKSYTYDQDYKLIGIFTEESNGGVNLESDSLKKYIYNDDGNITEVIEQYWANSAWHNFKRTEYSYISTFVNEDPAAFKMFTLSDSYPNPFNSTAAIEYTIAEASLVLIKIFDILGNEITTLVNTEQQAGIYKVEFYGNDLPSGIYLCKLTTNKYAGVKKMLLLK